MKLLRAFLKEEKMLLLFTLLLPFLFLSILWLYGLPTGPFWYAALLGILLGAAIWTIRFITYRRQHLARVELLKHLLVDPGTALTATTLADKDYMEMLAALSLQIRQMTEKQLQETEAAQDYYTLWVHQIKTPISAIRMLLQSSESTSSAALQAELCRIQQYADMALQYIRLEQSQSDLSFRECLLDPIIRSTIRKFAPLFIAKKLCILYEGTDKTVLTDEKWLAFMLEQLLSNAVKYTLSGSVSIAVSNDLQLTVSDTGIGIAPQDLPRIFEKGFTGQNGRDDRKATGLGLYLCSKAARKLNVTLSADSEVNKGTTVTIHLSKECNKPD